MHHGSVVCLSVVRVGADHGVSCENDAEKVIGVSDHGTQNDGVREHESTICVLCVDPRRGDLTVVPRREYTVEGVDETIEGRQCGDESHVPLGQTRRTGGVLLDQVTDEGVGIDHGKCGDVRCLHAAGQVTCLRSGVRQVVHDLVQAVDERVHRLVAVGEVREQRRPLAVSSLCGHGRVDDVHEVSLTGRKGGRLDTVAEVTQCVDDDLRVTIHPSTIRGHDENLVGQSDLVDFVQTHFRLLT